MKSGLSTFLISATLVVAPVFAASPLYALEFSQNQNVQQLSNQSGQQNGNQSENKLVLSWGADFAKGYFWRGSDMEHKGSFQPYLSATWHNFTLGAWSAFRATGDGEDEFDVYISKEIGPLTIALFDYWSYRKDNRPVYFDLDNHTTSHLLECQIILTGGERVPLNFLAGWFFHGADPSKSIYMELQYVHPVFKGEAVIYAGYQARGDYYAEKPSFVNAGISLTYPLTIFQHDNFGVFADLMGSPYTKKLFFNFGLSFFR